MGMTRSPSKKLLVPNTKEPTAACPLSLRKVAAPPSGSRLMTLYTLPWQAQGASAFALALAGAGAACAPAVRRSGISAARVRLRSGVGPIRCCRMIRPF
jgi:hypothetical protein